MLVINVAAMTRRSRGRLARPERIRIALADDPGGGVPLPLPSRRMWPAGLAMGAFFAVFAGIAAGQIASMRGQRVETVFDLMIVLFQGFWVLGWSVGVLVLFLLTVLFLFYQESARIANGRLIHVPCLGPLKIIVEYDLAKVRNLRAEGAGAEDRARIRFDYGGGEKSLGNDLPRADAEALIRTIQAAMPGVSQPGPEEPRPAPAREEPVPVEAAVALSNQPPARTSNSSWALLGANLIPLAGVLVFGWNLGEVMVLFWAENAVIGFYNLLKLAVIAKWGVVFVGTFFLGHYGGFMAGHFLFIYALFVRGLTESTPEAPFLAALGDLFIPLWPALLALLISHGVSFYANFLGEKEYVGRSAGQQMGEPYKRVIVLHVTIIFGGWVIMLLKSPLPALLLLIVLKTAVDLRAHWKEHRPGREGPLNKS